MNFDKYLVNTPANKIEEWREIIRTTLESGKNVIFVGDTETTGTEPKGDRANKDLRCRMLEVALIAYKADGVILEEPLLDSEGTHIFFHEYVNPFKEDSRILERYNSIPYIPNSVLYVHGITETFLKGETGLLDSALNETDYKLPKPAPTFAQIKPILEHLCCLDMCNELKGRVCLLAHNAPFDVEFLDCEWAKVEFLHEGNTAPSSFESYFKPVDTLTLIKQMYRTRDEVRAATPSDVMEEVEALAEKGQKIAIGWSLEFLRYFYKVEIPRDVHGAMIDSIILAEVYRRMTEDPRYLKLPIVKDFKSTPIAISEIDETGLINL